MGSGQQSLPSAPEVLYQLHANSEVVMYDNLKLIGSHQHIALNQECPEIVKPFW